jgi:hypothetical protein
MYSLSCVINGLTVDAAGKGLGTGEAARATDEMRLAGSVAAAVTVPRFFSTVRRETPMFSGNIFDFARRGSRFMAALAFGQLLQFSVSKMHRQLQK